MATDSSERILLLNELGEEFAARYRRGERPSLQEYIDRHPELADDIREFFPAMAEMEQAKEDRQEASEATAVGPLPPLERLGDYRIIREIGRGGMGVVYEAEQLSLGRHVALKVLPKQFLVDDRTKRRFEREAKAAARLHHTNIVPVFGVGEHDGLPYYAMQFIPGLGLDEVLEELRRMHWGEPSGVNGEPGGVNGEPGGVSPGNLHKRTGELRVSPKDISAAAVARSLMTGRFTPAPGDEDEAPAVRSDATAAHTPGPGTAWQAGPNVETPGAGRLSDTFALSSSSVELPGASRQAGKKQLTYWQSVAQIGVQVADALEYAHCHGIQHRDIKPSNLLLDTTGTVWVTDFGLAKADDEQNLTHPGDILGTLRYMPPEAFDGKTDARGDIYSLGLTLYELLAFRPAFDEKERNRLIKQVTTAEPVRLDRLNRELPGDLATIVHKAIDRDPARRYPTAGELEADLQRFLDDEPIRARRISLGERFVRWCRHNPAVAGLVAVIQIALLGLVGMAWWSKGRIDLALEEKEVERSRAVVQEKEAIGSRDAAVAETYQALVSQTQALRLARSSGWRGIAASNLRRLLAIDTPRKDLVEIRSEAVACLAELDVSSLQVFHEHQSSVWSVHFSPDGKFLVSADWLGAVFLRDLAQGSIVRLNPGSLFPPASFLSAEGHLPAVRFHPSGDWLAYALPGKGVALRGLDEAKPPVARLEGKAPARSVAMDEKGSVLAVSWGDGLVAVFDAASGALRRTIATGAPAAAFYRHLAVSPSGARLAVAGPNFAVQLHFLAEEKAPVSLGRHRGAIRGLAFNPDGRYLASSSMDRSVKVWDVATATEHLTLQGHDSAVNEIAFNPRGDLIATVSDDQTLRLWDARTGQSLQVIHPNLGSLLGVAFSPDGARLAVGSGIPGQKVGVFQVADPRVQQRLAGHLLRNVSRVTSLSFHPREALLASGGSDRQVILRDVSTGRTIRKSEKQPNNPIGSLAFSPDGELLATAPSTFYIAPTPNSDLAVYLLETQTGAVRRRLLWQRPGDGFPSNPGHIASTAFDPTGKLLAVGGGTLLGTGIVLVWDALSGEPVQRWHFRRSICGVAFVGGPKQMVVGDAGGRIHLLNVANGGTLREATVPASADLDMAVAPDGSQLVVASNEALYVFQLPDLELIATKTKVHTGLNTRVAVSGGQLLASGGNDRQVILWDARSLERLVVLPPHSSDVESLALSPDGSRLAIGGRDEFVTVWDLGLVRKSLSELSLDWKQLPGR